MFSFLCLRCSLNMLGGRNCFKSTRQVLKIYKNSACNKISITSLSSEKKFSTSQQLPKIHTTKNWKYIARDGVKPAIKSNSDVPPIACEEGKGAVPHSVLISKLQNCPTVSAQIETFCSLLSLTAEEIERRKAFCQSLENAFKIYLSEFKVHLFGSSVNGLGFKGCDADVCLQTNFNQEDYIILKDVPTLEGVLNGTVSRETLSRMTPLYTVRFIRRIMRKHCPDIKEPILLVKARCPILRFYDKKHDVFCDFSCESKTSLQNSKLIRLICRLEEKFVTIAKVVRYWGKYGGFVGDIDMFNSYAFSLLVVHFLQTTNPPILPSIGEMLNKSKYLQYGDVNDTELLNEDLKKFSPSENSKTVEELLKEFYFYFLSFDFSRVMLLHSRSLVPRTEFIPEKNDEDTFEFGAVNIQDPFRHAFNVTSCATFKIGVRFLNGLVQACDAYQNEALWTYKSENWGLSSLFCPPVHDSKITKAWQENRLITLEMSPKHDAAAKLRRILEHGLLFHCTEFLPQDDSSDSKQLLKMHCKAYNNVWQGRDWVSKTKYQNNESHLPLDLEHLISKDLVKTNNKRQILCEFHCECCEVRRDNELKLVLNFGFVESKFPPIVPIFLKEFIPHIFRQL